MRTKIIATIGPATASAEAVLQLARTGVDVVRVNFAHVSHENAQRVIEWTRAASDTIGKPMAVLADLAGPKIRIGALTEPVTLAEGTEVVLAPEQDANAGELPTTYADLASDVEGGARILLDDGLMELRVERTHAARIHCTVLRGGLLHSNKGINLPGIVLSTPALTTKDLRDLEFVLGHDIDYVGLSFVQRPADVSGLRERVPAGVLIVAKIEKGAALTDIEAILEQTDAVMVARGDLGVELPFEQVPIAQKRIIQHAHLFARPVITATQMLESMIGNPRPTRAEASDVANAVFDGTDAVMLSGETAVGRYADLAVDAMVRIGLEIERSQKYEEGPKYDVPLVRYLRAGATPTQHAIAAATVEAVNLLGAPAIVTFTTTGGTSRLVSSYRPAVPVLGVSDRRRTWRQLALVWGVQPVFCAGEPTYENMLAVARAYLFEHGIAAAGDRVVVTAGVPFHVPGTTNMLRVEEL